MYAGVVIAVALLFGLASFEQTHHHIIQRNYDMPNSEVPSDLHVSFKGMVMPAATHYVYRVDRTCWRQGRRFVRERGWGYGAGAQRDTAVVSGHTGAAGIGFLSLFVVANGTAHNVLGMTWQSFFNGSASDEETAQGTDQGVLCR